MRKPGLIREPVRTAKLLAHDSELVRSTPTLETKQLKSAWSYLFEDTFRIVHGLPLDDAKTRQTCAITLGICTDKLLLLDGKPTQTVLNVHEVRGSLPDLLAKLTGVRAAIEITASAAPITEIGISDVKAIPVATTQRVRQKGS